MSKRQVTTPVLDSTMLPNGSMNIPAAISLADDLNHVLDLTAIGLPTGVTPTVILLYSEGGAFVCGEEALDQTHGLPHLAGLYHRIPAPASGTLNLKRRAGASTVTVWAKIFYAR